MKEVALFFLQRRVVGGGTTVFTAHLAEGFRQLGFAVSIITVRESPKATVEFGEYGFDLQTLDTRHALIVARNMPSIIVSSANAKDLPKGLTKRLLSADALPVLHDLTKQHHYPTQPSKLVCIRRSIARYIGSQYIGHPYSRQCSDNLRCLRPTIAISTARVDSSKRTNIICRANELLPKSRRIKILGSEFRLYSWGLHKRYGFKQTGKLLNWPLTFRAPVELCLQAKFNVDLSRFPHDGGGTQYTQLEAMDAGCVNVMHTDWLWDDGDRREGDLRDNVHVLTVSNEHELSALVSSERLAHSRSEIAGNCYRLLKQHDAKRIAKQYLELIK